MKLSDLDRGALRAFADTLPDARRAWVRDGWARAAQTEHASIASFDRFSLQLLSVAAPPSLIEAAHRAAIDEVHHAQLSFAVASAYAGHNLGPGPLAITHHALADFSVAFVVQSAVEEGCVGETLAAAEAEAAAQGARCTLLREVLAKIAADEAEHAALAYQFVSWALHALGNEARKAIEQGFEVALARVRGDVIATESHAAGGGWLQEHGLLSDQTRRDVHQRAVAEVIVPARAALLGR